MTDSPALSVVVCTHNRRRDLERCLEAMSTLDDTVEVIVVDSASDPPCAETVQRLGSRIPGLVYVREDRPGLSRARNMGLELARAPLVAFIDDDAAPRSDWAQHITAPFATDASIGCVGGACTAVFPDRPRPTWLSDRLLQFAGITNYSGPAREARSSAEWPFGANIAFRTGVLKQAGGFSEALGRNGTLLLSGEESALIETARKLGWKIWLEPRAIVDHAVHAERCASSYYWRRLWWAGIGRARSGSGVAQTLPRLLIAAPARILAWIVTRDRVHLYRTAETAGYLFELTGLRGSR
jgi:glucosyl-dolichyl phosphate glucuronosyltransferase